MSDSLQPQDCSPSGCSVHDIFQARKLAWVAICYCRESSPPKDWTWVSCIAGGGGSLTEPPYPETKNRTQFGDLYDSLIQNDIHLTPCESRSAAAAAKSLQSCPTLCDPVDGSPSGSPVPGILQARTLEWVATSFSNA